MIYFLNILPLQDPPALLLLIYLQTFIKSYKVLQNFTLLSNLTYVTFQGNSEIWSHKTGDRLIQGRLVINKLCNAINKESITVISN
jgi:hypothetical protein